MANADTAKLPSPQHDWALFFDIDGTLLDLAATPDAVIVPAALRDNLVLLSQRPGAIALITGRSLASVDALFAPLILPAAGQHGAEARTGRERMADPPLSALRALVAPLAEFASDHHGIILEDKGDTLAVHYRMAPALADEVQALADRLTSDTDELEVLSAKMAVDIKPRGVSKGRAVLWFMARPPFAGKIPVFVGDDRTDETAFAVVNERGGHAIRVGAPAESAARFSLKSPAAVREWIAGLARFYSRAEGP